MVYAAALKPVSSQESLYSTQTAYYYSEYKFDKFFFLCIFINKLFCCRGGQELDVVSLVSRDAARQEDGISLSIVAEEPDDVLDLHIGQSVVRYALCPLVNPRCKARGQKTGFYCHETILS